ncbi:MAG: Sir2 family NAD-dependent protein deacetylase [Planctomycetales bacterium]|nr:Sir2 family NAD-dependent protein deacetylase [Planctomycetales bacterium]
MMHLNTLAGWLQAARSAVVLTGAGVSTDSGIPDFRSPGGIWSRQRPVEYDDFVNSASARHRYWQQKCAGYRDFAAARPNVTHQVLAQWERAGVLRGVITQNIDGLHQDAGSQRVLELHGTVRQVACLRCPFRDQADTWVESFLSDGRVPDCPACGAPLKHATISFGQAMPEVVLSEAIHWCRAADLILTLGTSLVVMPAADLPRLAVECGARFVIINRDPTPLDRVADLVFNQSLDGVMTELEKLVRLDSSSQPPSRDASFDAGADESS